MGQKRPITIMDQAGPGIELVMTDRQDGNVGLLVGDPRLGVRVFIKVDAETLVNAAIVLSAVPGVGSPTPKHPLDVDTTTDHWVTPISGNHVLRDVGGMGNLNLSINPDMPDVVQVLSSLKGDRDAALFVRLSALTDAALTLSGKQQEGVVPPAPLDENDYATIIFALGYAAGRHVITPEAVQRIIDRINERPAQ